MFRRTPAGLVVVSVLLAALSAARPVAQHGYTAEEVAEGAKRYQATCAGCHGPDGDLVSGVALGSGQFRRATTDDELVRIVRNGIPGTAMSASAFTDREAGTIVAYLRSLNAAGVATAPGDAMRGRALFDGKGQCATCHGSGASGSRLAPALAEVAGVRRPAEIERAILDPGAELAADFQPVRAVTRDGTTITGRLLNQDTFSVQLLDSNEQLQSLEKTTLRELTIGGASPMPAYRGTLSAQEVADLVAYVRSLGGGK